MTDGALRDQRDATLALLSRLIRRGRDLHGRCTQNTQSQIISASSASSALYVEIRIWQNDCAAAVNELSGGSKAHWLSRGFSDALLMRSRDGDALVSANPADIVDRILDVLGQAARSLADVDAASVAAAGEPPPRRFEFVHEAALRPVLEQALVESGRAFEDGDYARALMTTCGILEAIITDALDANARLKPRAPSEPVPPNTSASSFEQRIAAAEKAGLIGRGCARLPAAARAYRDAPLDATVIERDAKVAAQVLRVVMRDLDPGR